MSTGCGRGSQTELLEFVNTRECVLFNRANQKIILWYLCDLLFSVDFENHSMNQKVFHDILFCGKATLYLI